MLAGTSAWEQVEAFINAAGKFEFPIVPSGTYTVRTLPGSSAALATVLNGDRDVTGLQVRLMPNLPGKSSSRTEGKCRALPRP